MRYTRPHVLRPVSAPLTQEEIRDKLFARAVVTVDRCLEWQGAKAKGYGYINLRGRARRVHRVAYEIFVGPIPEGHELDHLCRNRACFRPDHLEPVTRSEHLRRQHVRAGHNVKEVA